MGIIDIIQSIIQAIISSFRPRPSPPEFISQLLQLHNDHRQQLGIPALTLNNILDVTAQSHSDWMYNNHILSHLEGNVAPQDRISAAGYPWKDCGENIGNYPSAQSMFEAWLESPEHRSNIENVLFKDVGIGLTGNYWTVDFGLR